MEKETIDISVIIPIESSKHLDFSMYLERCITSLINQSITPNEVVIVHSGEETLKTILEGYDYSGLTVNLIHNKGKFDFSSQINLGVQNAKSKYVSFLEFDDEYANIWFKNVKNYIEAYPDHEGFLPLVVDVDEKGAFAGFTNEATFAASMNNEIGYLTNELLINYQNFQTSGMVIKKQTFQDFGGFKSSMKLTFVYEFLLRMTYNSAKLMTIPKIGYKHINLRTGSIFWNYKNGEIKMIDDEVKFWIQTAKKEFFFVDDRTIKYQSETV
jgi:glycosyltransferase involved in cell wall biosynthesis